MSPHKTNNSDILSGHLLWIWLQANKSLLNSDINFNNKPTVYKLTPSNDEDHDEHGSSSTSQDLHEACFQGCWQGAKIKAPPH